jgi:hypothetical protein
MTSLGYETNEIIYLKALRVFIGDPSDKKVMIEPSSHPPTISSLERIVNAAAISESVIFNLDVPSIKF